MSFEALHERVTDLQETINQSKALIDRLATLQCQPEALPPNADDEDNVAGELGSEISQVLGEAEEELELLQEEVIDFRGDRNGNSDGVTEQRARLEEGTARLALELKSSRTAFRKAQLSARRSLEQARRLKRHILLASYSASAMNSPGNRSGASSPASGAQPATATTFLTQAQQPNSASSRQQLFTARDRRRLAQKANNRGASADGGDDAAVSASSDVTAALRRTHALIADSVARNEFARQTLAESTAALGQLQNAYAGLDDMLASSRDLLGTLLSSQKSDTWYLQTALYLLLGTLAWLMFRRLLYGPLWWLVWLPLRLMWRSGNALAQVGGRKGGERMQIGNVDGRGAKVVGVGEQGAVPAAPVGVQQKEGFGVPGSMVDKVAKMVDGAVHEGEELDGRSNNKLESAEINSATAEDEGPNPKKRIWEEGESEPTTQERTKDGL